MALAAVLPVEAPTLTLVKITETPTVAELTQQIQDLRTALRETLTILAYAGISGAHLVNLPDVP
jgi:hypothetical protein